VSALLVEISPEILKLPRREASIRSPTRIKIPYKEAWNGVPFSISDNEMEYPDDENHN